jgi:metacaspase-1
MPRGMCLSIGLNSVDPASYGGWSGDLNACEADAKDVGLIAASMNHNVTTLLTAQATRANVIQEIGAAAGALGAGDLFILFYSGHGGQLPDHDGDETDGLDETWCLYDGEFVDDEIYAALCQFQPGVRIFSMSDSCHSGTVLKADELRQSLYRNDPVGFRAMPMSIASRTYFEHKPFYDAILTNPALPQSKANIQASAILISGCMDNQLSADGLFNGRFTGEMKKVWNGGKFDKGYEAFCQTIRKNMPADQTPNFFTVGPADPAFAAQQPFLI